MHYLSHLLQTTGSASLHIFWLPVGIWTAVAVAGFISLGIFGQKIPVAYHYHSRVALLYALAAGVVGSLISYLLPLKSISETGSTIKFIVIQAPISVVATTQTNSFFWSNPDFWIGAVTAVAGVLAVLALIKFAIEWFSLLSFAKNLRESDKKMRTLITGKNREILLINKDSIYLFFSDEIAVPCTFGLFKKRIIIPNFLQHDAENLNIAVRHELIHIKNHDFLMNIIVKIIRALFFFHPLVHVFCNQVETYREIYCDQQVLQDEEISPKKYAHLLFKLAPQSVFKTPAALNMSVQPSTLKKRIQTMKKSIQKIPSLRRTITFMFIFVLAIAGLMCFSGIAKNSKALAKVQQTPAKSPRKNIAPPDTLPSMPIYLVNGEKTTRDTVSRLKTKYIQSIEVFKGKKATIQKYGKAAKNGVIDIHLKNGISRKKALNDLKLPPVIHAKKMILMQDTSHKEKIYVAVQQPPKLKGGLKKLETHVTYPMKCRRAGAQGRVTLVFVVNKKGMPTHVHVLHGIGHGCDQAAVQTVKKYARFTPAMQNGKPVNMRYSLPLTFILAGGNNKVSPGKNSKGIVIVAYPGVRDSSNKNVFKPVKLFKDDELNDSSNANRK